MKYKKYTSPLLALFLAVLLGLFFFLAHFHYMQRSLDWDQIVYGNNILRSTKSNTPPIFNPHHLHYEIGGKIFHQWVVQNWGENGFTDLSFNQRLRSLIIACVGLFFLVLLLTELTGKISLGILGAFLAGVTHGYLSYSTRMDTGIFPSAWFILFLWILLRMVKAKKGLIYYSIPAALVLFIGVMFHQYSAFGCVVFCLVLIIPEKAFGASFKPDVIQFKRKDEVTQKRARASKYLNQWFTAGLTALMAIIFIIGGYFLAGKTIYRLPFDKGDTRISKAPWVYDNLTFQEWLFHYAYIDHGNWGKGLEEFTPDQPFRGFSEALLARPRTKISSGSPLNYNIKDFFNPENFTHNLAALISFFTLFASLFLFPQLLKRYKQLFLFSFLCFIVFSLFTTYWEPYYFEFWITPALLIVILFIMILNLLTEKLYRVFGKISLVPAFSLLLFLVLCFSSHNLGLHFRFFSLEQKLYGYNSAWDRDYYMRLFSRGVYQNPDDPYKNIYPHLK